MRAKRKESLVETELQLPIQKDIEVEKKRKHEQEINGFFTRGFIHNEHKRSISTPKKATTIVLFPGY
jgi:hypothetical protein